MLGLKYFILVLFFIKVMVCKEKDIYLSYSFSPVQEIPGWEVYNDDNITYTDGGNSGVDTITWIFNSNDGLPGPEYIACHGGQHTVANHTLEDNWLITAFYPSNANTIYIEIICNIFRGSEGDCSELFSIHILQSDTLVDVSFNHDQFEQISVQTLNSNFVTSNFSLSLNGFFIAFRNTGYCVSLSSFRFYYEECPSSDQLPGVPVPTPSDEPTFSNLICPEGSVSLRQAECYSNGSWLVPETAVCECERGRKKMDQSCIVCPENTYKFDIGNDNTCVRCPGMSSTNGSRGSVSCECDEGWYRGAEESVDMLCGRSPSVVGDLLLERGRGSTRVSWTAPVDVWNRSVSYNVSLYLEKEGSVELVWRDNIGDTEYVLSESVLGSTSREYLLVVTSLNNLVVLSGVENNVSVRFVSIFPEVVDMSVRLNDGILEWQYRLEGGMSNLRFELEYTNNGGGLSAKTVSGCVAVSTAVYKCSVSVVELNESLNIVITLLPLSPDVTNGVISQTYNLDNPMVRNTVSDKPISENTVSVQIAISVVVTFAILLVSVIIILGLLAAVYFRHRRRKCDDTPTLYNNVYPMEAIYQDPGLYDDLNTAVRRFAKEIDHQDLEYKEYIGEGEFAGVCKGVLKKDDQRIMVAIKTLKPDTNEKNKQDFFGEASIMGQFNHPNVIFLYGVTLAKPIVIITPLMENGSLDDFMRQKEKTITTIQQVRICVGVACGMEYLTKIGFVHRDLAARNVLIDSEWTPKICDFGLSRETEEDLYNVKSGGKIPVRWTAPEAIAYRRFNEASDVWSFGVLVWEVTSFGRVPYAGIDIVDLLEKVQYGYRLEKPDLCPDPLYNLMLSCWQSKARSRPTFSEVLNTLNSLIVANFVNKQRNGVSVYNPESFSTEDWLDSIGLSRYSRHFQEDGYCSLIQTCSLRNEDLIKLGIVPLTHRSTIMKSISEMHEIMLQDIHPVSVSD